MTKNIKNKEREALIKRLLSENKKNLPDEKVLMSSANKRRGQAVINAITNRYGSEKAVYAPTLQDEAVAYTDGRKIVVNLGHEMVTTEKDIKGKRKIEQGLYSHECGHVLFTDFDVLKKTLKSWEEAKKILFACNLFPYFNANIFKEMNDIFKDYPQIIESVFMFVSNAFEDAYIEDKLKKLYKGSILTSIDYTADKLRKSQLKNADFNWGNCCIMIARDCLPKEIYDKQPEYEKVKKLHEANMNGFCSYTDRMGRAFSVMFVLWEKIKPEIEEAIKQQEMADYISNMIGDALENLKKQEQKDGMASKQVAPSNSMNGGSSSSKSSNSSNGSNTNKNGSKSASASSSDNSNAEDEKSNGGGKNGENDENRNENDGNGENGGNGGKSDKADSEEKNGNGGDSEDTANTEDEKFDGSNNSSCNSSDENGSDNTNSLNNSENSENSDAEANTSTDSSSSASNQSAENKSKDVSFGNGSQQRSFFDSDFFNNSENSESSDDSDASSDASDNSNNGPRIIDNGTAENTDDGEEGTIESVGEEEYFNNIKSLPDQTAENKKTDATDTIGNVDNGTAEVVKQALNELLSDDYDYAEKLADDLELGEIVRNDLHKNTSAKVYHIRSGNKEKYNDIVEKEQIVKLSKNLQRKVEKDLFERRKGSVKHNLYSGKNIDLKSICNGSNKVFMQNKLPNNKPLLAASILIDQSGSMDGTKIYKATVASMLLEDFCRNLNIPFSVTGHSTSYGGVELYDYIDFGERNKSARERLINISSGGCNRDGYAIRYVVNKLLKRKEETKLLFVISDGLPNDYDYGTKELIADLKNMKKKNQSNGIVIVPLCIEKGCFSELKAIYGSSLVDATDLKKFPITLNSILAKELKKKLS